MVEAEFLERLRAHLAERGVPADLRGEALVVHPHQSHLPVWVFVGYGGRFFSWQHAERRHPVADVPGAADALAAYVSFPASLFSGPGRP
ncbi:hypothetical protein [Planomonospora venezuelensis]|uniref:Uncharacterized protein n=1 Tax=Planomonospora venezuelensis TaxID=1999 RepID=A0A841CXY8_PLAVE|nr:hypothetical protein [Planomonospora venezuelensis]MBB5960988.1 hypothetical protein [Planomonospora venezuelensis]GIN01222.1 hypothetical protein Pve01_28800 [Planomonospora venezuelensis]